MHESPIPWPWITLGPDEVERSRATDAASSEAIGTLAEPLGLLSRVATGPLHGGRATQRGPNARYVINALANSMRNGVAGSTPVKDCASQQASATWRYSPRSAAPHRREELRQPKSAYPKFNRALSGLTFL